MDASEAKPDELNAFECIRNNIFTLYKVSQRERRKSQQKWQDDCSMLQAYIEGNAASRQILKAEQKRLYERLSRQTKTLDPEVDFDLFMALEDKRNELSAIQLQFEKNEREEAEVRQRMNSGIKAPELDVWEPKLTIVQDVRRMCLEHMQQAQEEIARMEKEHGNKARNQTRANLASVRDQLTRVETKLDSAKRMLSFPPIDGFRFRAGSSGVYVGAKDLHILDASGSFLLTADEGKGSNSNEDVGKLKLQLGGASVQSEDGTPISVATRTPSMTALHSQDGSSLSSRPPRTSSIERNASGSPEVPPVQSNTEQVLQPKVNLGQVSEEKTPPHTPWLPQSVRTNHETSRTKRVVVKLLKKVATKDKIPRMSSRQNGTRIEAPKKEGRPRLISHFLRRRKKGMDDRAGLKNQLTEHLKAQSMKRLVGTQTPSVEKRLQHHASNNVEDGWEVVGLNQPRVSEGRSSSELEAPVYARDEAGATSNLKPDPQDVRNNGEYGVHLGNNKRPSVSSGHTPVDSSSRTSNGRRGVFVKAKAEELNLIGERGTRVPNLVVKEIMLEVECLVSVDLEYSSSKGWEFCGGVVFEIIDVKKQVTGSSLPLPLTLVKTVMNMLLPKLVERILASSLPVEFGEYVLDSGSKGMLSGQIVIVGPPLGTMQADLAANFHPKSGKKKSGTEDMKKSIMAKEAWTLLGITASETEALREALCGDETLRLAEAPTRCSIAALCEFHRKFATTETWDQMCSLWDRGLKLIGSMKGCQWTVGFKDLMNGIIAHLDAKPLRIKVVVTRLSLRLNIDELLTALRDYAERSARELDGIQVSQSPGTKVPLDTQLKALEVWHKQWSTQLSGFKSKFKYATCKVVGTADSKTVDLGLDRFQYEGPLNIQIPVASKEDDVLSVNISLPLNDSKTRIGAVANGIKEMKEALKNIAFQTQGQAVGNCQTLGVETWTQPCQAPTQTLPIGKLLLQRLSMGFCLNEAHLARMLVGNADLHSSTPCVSPIGLQHILGSLGDLMSFNLGAGSGQNNEQNPYILTLDSGELMRLRLDAKCIGFQSSVSPVILVRGIQAFVEEMLSSWPSCVSEQLAVANIIFTTLVRYIAKEALDIGICSQLQASISDDKLCLFVLEVHDSEGSICSPVHFVNDVNMMEVAESFNVMQEMSHSGGLSIPQD